MSSVCRIFASPHGNVAKARNEPHGLTAAIVLVYCLAFASLRAEPPASVAASRKSAALPGELVYLHDGVIRWSANKQEVALFGANYCLPSASDYRAAGYVHADRKKLVEKDLAHFVRMGWDGLRFSFWGDWENCDKEGNLIVNEHLDVMDYAIAEATKRGIYILLTPITTYSAWWPDGRESDPYPGFAAGYPRGELSRNPKAIAAGCNYIRQLLNHGNPYTGRALKNEPAILFIEMINEPVHHSSDLPGSIAFINALVDAVRETGCQKFVFHNVSQDFNITPALKASRVQGVTFGWYPTGLNSGHTLAENYLRTVDEFSPMLRTDLRNFPRLVYEFDTPDMSSGFMYPAMARAFRGVGAQFIAMFSYDMVDTAPYNLGWQTHFLNLVYSPRKAVSAIIAAEATRRVPQYAHFGEYPDNCRFGPFRVSYENDLSEMVTEHEFFYSNDTQSSPSKPKALDRIVGVGCSPLVDYEGCGSYFLDKLKASLWRLELYPDAVLVQDPFAQWQNYRTVSSRLVSRAWPMTLRLPDLGKSFEIIPLNTGNTHRVKAAQGRFEVKPGVYLLSKNSNPNRKNLPGRIRSGSNVSLTEGQISKGKAKDSPGIGLTEFVCPEAPDLPAQLLPRINAEYIANQPLHLAADVIDSKSPGSVQFHTRSPTEAGPFPLYAARGYRYETIFPPGLLKPGRTDYYFTVSNSGEVLRFPPREDNFWSFEVVAPNAPVQLFVPPSNPYSLAYTRIGDNIRGGIFKSIPATNDEPAALRLFFPRSYDRSLDDYTVSVSVKTQLMARASSLAAAAAIRVKARAGMKGQAIHVTLVEADGTSWTEKIALLSEWEERRIPLDQLDVGRGVKLPLGFPGRWNYWITPAKGRGGPGDRLRLERVEHLQISFRPDGPPPASQSDAWADLASVTIVFD